MRLTYAEIVRGTPIGAGIDGTVYRQRRSGRVVKVSHNSLEAEWAEGLVGHTMRYVVKIYDVYNLEPNVNAIVMEKLIPLNTQETELVEHNVRQYQGMSSTAAWLRRVRWGVRGERKVEAKLARNIKEGLAALERHGLQHRDLHSGNIMKSRSGAYKIIDMSIMANT